MDVPSGRCTAVNEDSCVNASDCSGSGSGSGVGSSVDVGSNFLASFFRREGRGAVANLPYARRPGRLGLWPWHGTVTCTSTSVPSHPSHSTRNGRMRRRIDGSLSDCRADWTPNHDVRIVLFRWTVGGHDGSHGWRRCIPLRCLEYAELSGLATVDVE